MLRQLSELLCVSFDLILTPRRCENVCVKPRIVSVCVSDEGLQGEYMCDSIYYQLKTFLSVLGIQASRQHIICHSLCSARLISLLGAGVVPTSHPVIF